MTSLEKKADIAQETIRLIENFKQGKAESFDRLIELYSGKLYRTVYGLLGSKQDAEEVVQDAFVRAYRALNAFRGDSSFETWIHRIAVNLARNKFHWNRRRGEGAKLSLSENTGDDSGECQEILLPDERMRPDFAMQNAEIESSVLTGISALPESLRETMLLRHIDDMPYEQIARVLDCKVGTVKSRLARGRVMLKNYLTARETT